MRRSLLFALLLTLAASVFAQDSQPFETIFQNELVRMAPGAAFTFQDESFTPTQGPSTDLRSRIARSSEAALHLDSYDSEMRLFRWTYWPGMTIGLAGMGAMIIVSETNGQRLGPALIAGGVGIAGLGIALPGAIAFTRADESLVRTVTTYNQHRLAAQGADAARYYESEIVSRVSSGRLRYGDGSFTIMDGPIPALAAELNAYTDTADLLELYEREMARYRRRRLAGGIVSGAVIGVIAYLESTDPQSLSPWVSFGVPIATGAFLSFAAGRSRGVATKSLYEAIVRHNARAARREVP